MIGLVHLPEASPGTVSRWRSDRYVFAFCLFYLKFLVPDFSTTNIYCSFCEEKKKGWSFSTYIRTTTHLNWPLVPFPGQFVDWPHATFHRKSPGVSWWFGAPEPRKAACFSFSFSCLFTMTADDLLVAFRVMNTCHRLQVSHTGGRAAKACCSLLGDKS